MPTSAKQYRLSRGARGLMPEHRIGIVPARCPHCGGRYVDYQQGAPNLLRCDNCEQKVRKIKVIL